MTTVDARWRRMAADGGGWRCGRSQFVRKVEVVEVGNWSDECESFRLLVSMIIISCTQHTSTPAQSQLLVSQFIPSHLWRRRAVASAAPIDRLSRADMLSRDVPSPIMIGDLKIFEDVEMWRCGDLKNHGEVRKLPTVANV